jgi:hypothetical protein
MGFLNFLKKKEKGELDIPPPPPIEEVGEFGEKEDLFHDAPKSEISSVKQEASKTNVLAPPPIEDYLKSTKKSSSGQIETLKTSSPPSIEKSFHGFNETKEHLSTPPKIEIEEKPVHPLKDHIIPQSPFLKKDETRIQQSQQLFKPIEKKEIKPEKKQLLEKQMPKKPIFVKSDDYKQILDSISIIRNKLKETESIAARLNEIKNMKDKEFERWRSELEDIQRKTLYIDKTLFEGDI